jgi:hypothetical protein
MAASLMAKPHRSPLLGYNHNVGHLGRVFHVQTEDSGPGTPHLYTHLFHEGTILASRKQDYSASLPDEQVRALMQAQHRTVIKDLAHAIFDEKIIAFFYGRGVPAPTPAPVDEAHGAMPLAPMSETPGPTAVPLAVGPRRTTTRALESSGARGPTPAPVAARSAESRRPPFVRSGTPGVSSNASADGVVVQRNVVVGGPTPASGRPVRIRPPVPYIVTGGSHPARSPSPSSAPSVAGAAVEVAAPARPAASAAPVSAVEAPRVTGAFAAGLSDDKSLDEVILEYLSEDGD